jgi:hypothetical protein
MIALVNLNVENRTRTALVNAHADMADSVEAFYRD